MTKIGLEIHTYLNTKEKLFCSCPAEHGSKYAKPNTNICPICTGQPGCKPQLPNSSAIKKAIQIALILGCKVNGVKNFATFRKGKEKSRCSNFEERAREKSAGSLVWQRKHYSWPDLPKGFQNTISGPHSTPNGINGKFEEIKITECHLEEDPASWNPKTGEIDYNRSGSPLIEIVTEPEFKNSKQVIEWLKNLIATLNYIKAIDKRAGIKVDVNISIKGGERIEVKNVNSLTNIQKVIDYEIKRQKKEIPKQQETRRFNKDNTTTKMRSKEEAADYRFISEPDLPALLIDKKRIEQIKKSLPETPKEKLTKLIKKYKVEKNRAEILIKKLEIVEFFEKVIEKSNPRLAIRWITEELFSLMNYEKKELEELNLNPIHFIELLDLIGQGILTESKAKDILRSWKEKSSSPKKQIKKHLIISDSSEIKKIVERIIKGNKKAVKDFQEGEPKALNFLIGQVMKQTDKRADYKAVKQEIEKLIK